MEDAAGTEETGLVAFGDGIDNPWEFLNKVRELDLADRPEHLPKWLDLVAHKPSAEQDALVTEGRVIFGYRMETARKTLREMGEVIEGLAQTEVSLVTDEFMAETIYRPGNEKPFGYLVHRFDHPDDPPEFVERIEHGRSVYYPPGNKLAEKGVVLFPSGIEEYDNDWAIFGEIRNHLTKYLQLDDPHFETLACCYVLMTWVFDRFWALPYLRAQGDLGTGKTTLINVVGTICNRPMKAGGATTEAPIFRIIDRFRGTLIMDEADFDKSDLYQGIIKVLNNGYSRGFLVLRAERDGADNFDVKGYDCFGPKLLATRRKFADGALESRCLSHTMPLLEDVKKEIPLALGDEFYAESLSLRNKLLLWRFRNYSRISADLNYRMPGQEARINQIIQPILACAVHPRLRGTVEQMIVEYSRRVKAERREGLEGSVVAATLKTWFRQRKPDRFLLKTVVETMQQEQDMAKVSNRRVSQTLNSTLGVETRNVGGNSWVFLTEAKAHQLAARYGLALSDYAQAAGLGAASVVNAAPLSNQNGGTAVAA